MAHPFIRSEMGIYATVSEQLQKAREHKQLSIESCASTIEIQKKFLTAIEESHFEDLPGEMYTRAWVKKYAAFLGLNTADIMISYEKEREIRKNMEMGQQTRIKKARLWDFLTLRRLSIIILVAAILTYIGYLIYATVSPPHITVDPAEGFKTQQNTITLRGQAEPSALVTVNNKSIALDADGAFREEISLNEGLNTITIQAKKKNSLSYIKELHIVRTLPPTIQTTTGQ